jgi:hypothetical protein
MKKISFKKIILLTLIASILSIGLSGCIDIILPTESIVYINIANDNYKYEIEVDSIYKGTTDSSGKLTIRNISVGYHLFEAYDTSFTKRYGSKYQFITAGSNYVSIDTF